MEKVVLFARKVRRLYKEYLSARVRHHEFLFLSFYGGNAESGGIGGRRAYGGGIGIARLVGVAEFRTERAAVIVGRGNHERNARVVNGIVNSVFVFVVRLVAETARHTQAEVYRVNAENNRVLESGEYIALFRARFVIAEHFHYGKLRVYRNARYAAVATRDYAGNVRAVRLLERHDIGVAVGVVETERYLVFGYVAVINVASGYIRIIAVRFGVPQKFFYIVFVQTRFDNLVRRKRGMGVVATRIEHRHNRALARIRHVAAVENAGIVYVYLVCNSFAGRVSLRYHNALHLGNVAYRGNLVVCSGYAQAVEHGIITVHNLGNKPRRL